jgi:hypothetical protein
VGLPDIDRNNFNRCFFTVNIVIIAALTRTKKTMSVQTVKVPIASLPLPLDLVPEGPIRTFPSEIIERILFFSNHSESTRLVCRAWTVLTFKATINFNNHELKQTFSLITEKLNLDTHAKYKTDLTELQHAHQPNSNHVTTFAEVRRLFMIVKGSVIGILRKLPEGERDQLQKILDDQFPNSMRDLFKLSEFKLPHPSLERFNHIKLDTLFTLLHSYLPLSIDDQEPTFEVAAGNNPPEFVRLLLANGPISEHIRGLVVESAAKNNNLELVRLLLADGPILKWRRGWTVEIAAENNNLELAKLLLANGPISKRDREKAIGKAQDNNNLDLITLLLNDPSLFKFYMYGALSPFKLYPNKKYPKLCQELASEDYYVEELASEDDYVEWAVKGGQALGYIAALAIFSAIISYYSEDLRKWL